MTGRSGRYTTVLFDLDHTLFDSDTSLRTAHDVTMRSVGLDPDGVYDRFERINSALWRRVELHEIAPDDVRVLRFEQLLAELSVDGDPVAMADTFVDVLAASGDLYEGARELLDELAAVAELGLVTNGIGSVQRGRLARLGIDALFATVVISGEAGVAKPSPAIFDLALADVVDRSTVVMIGDNLGSDIAGGVAAGIDTIWFNPRGEPTPPSGPAATHEVEALADISAIVR